MFPQAVTVEPALSNNNIEALHRVIVKNMECTPTLVVNVGYMTTIKPTITTIPPQRR